MSQPAVTRTLEPPCEHFGDVDRDQRVTPRDAILILQHEARLLYRDLDQKALHWGDITGDSEINASDALGVLQYAAGKIDTFPACTTYEPTHTATPTPTRTPGPIPTPGYISEPEIHEYMNIKVAVMYYGIGDEDLERLKGGLELARKFLTRNSKWQLNANLIYIPLTEASAGNAFDKVAILNSLKMNGYQPSDFGAIFHISTKTEGNWSYGLHTDPIKENVGFSFVEYPPRQPQRIAHPGLDSSVDYSFPWPFVHEFQHALDAMYDQSGYPELFHGDLPLIYAEKAGDPFYSFEAEGLRSFDHWLELGERWGTLKSFIDNNGNGIPDDDPSLPDDDVRLGSGWNKDSYTAGIFQGFLDGHPTIKTETIRRFTPVMDGRIEGGWQLLTEGEVYDEIDIQSKIYSAWDENFLYIAGIVDKEAALFLWIDGDGDGWLNGRKNIRILMNPATGFIAEARAMDASDAAREFQCTIQNPPNSEVSPDGKCLGIWDDDPDYPFGPIISKEDITAATNRSAGQYQFEIKVPIDSLSAGSEIGYRINFEILDEDGLRYKATPLEPFQSGYFTPIQ